MELSSKKTFDKRANAYLAYFASNTFAQTFMLTYISLYMTDYLGISVAFVATVLTIARFVGMFSTFFTGPIIQKIHPFGCKKGKYITWQSMLKYVLFITLIILFSDMTALGTTAAAWICGIGYILFTFCQNLVFALGFSMMAEMAGTDIEIRHAMTIAGSRGMAIANVAFAAITLPFITFMGKFLGANWSYTFVAGLWGLLFVIGSTIYTKACRPYEKENPTWEELKSDESGSMSIWAMWKAIFANKMMMIFLISDSIYYTGFYCMTTMAVYYFKLLGQFGNTYTLIQTILSLVAIAASFIGPIIGLKLGKKNAKITSYLINAVILLVFWLLGAKSVWVYFVVMCFTHLTTYFFSGFTANYPLDCAEWYQYNTGIDNRSACMSLSNFAPKVGLFLGGALSSYGLAFIGYSPDMTATAEFMNKFMTLVGVLPAIICALAGVLYFAYKISDKDAAMYAAENAKKREARNS